MWISRKFYASVLKQIWRPVLFVLVLSIVESYFVICDLSQTYSHSLVTLLYNTHSWGERAPIHKQLVHETIRELMKASLWKKVRVILGLKILWSFSLFCSYYFPRLYCVEFSVASCNVLRYQWVSQVLTWIFHREFAANHHKHSIVSQLSFLIHHL